MARLSVRKSYVVYTVPDTRNHPGGSAKKKERGGGAGAVSDGGAVWKGGTACGKAL